MSEQTMLSILKSRFDKNPARHHGIEWGELLNRIEGNSRILRALTAMEETGGEPDAIGTDATGGILIADCAAESPAGRRSLCYDRPALESRKEHPPAGSAIGMAETMGIELMDEMLYGALQSIGTFDTKTSSWLRTPEDVRSRGGALFGDWRYGRMFIYHNGAQSYYAARGFRGVLRV